MEVVVAAAVAVEVEVGVAAEFVELQPCAEADEQFPLEFETIGFAVVVDVAMDRDVLVSVS